MLPRPVAALTGLSKTARLPRDVQEALCDRVTAPAAIEREAVAWILKQHSEESCARATLAALGGDDRALVQSTARSGTLAVALD